MSDLHRIVIPSRNMHLAAYINEHPETVFVDYKDPNFIFESPISKSKWVILHANSKSRRVDINLLGLKSIVKGG